MSSHDSSLESRIWEEDKPSTDTSSVKKEKADVNIEKVDSVSDSCGDIDLSAVDLKGVTELEERLANDEATEAEFRVEEAYEVALKVWSVV